MTILHLLVLLSGIFGSFFFAGVETGFVSWNPLKVGYRARQGNIFAQWALYMIRNKERVISMVLIGNNVCIVGASVSFLYLFSRLSQQIQFGLDNIPSPETWFLSPVLVIFSEMLPKSLFRIYSFRLTMKSVPVLMILYWLTLPFTWIISVFGSLAEKNIRNDRSFMINVRKEMVLIAQEGSRRGTLFEYATLFINNILKLKDKTLEDIIHADKSDLNEVGFNDNEKKRVMITDTISDICKDEYLHTGDHVLVFDKDGREVVGWVSLLDIAKADTTTLISSIVKKLPNINKNTSLLTCFSKKVNFQYPFYRIIDESGNTQGILNRFSMFRLVFDRYSASY